MTNASITQRILFFSTLIFLVVLSGCTPTQNNTSSSVAPPQNQLRVGVSTNAPPMVYKSGSKLQGLEVDLAMQLGKYLNKEIRFVELRWDNQISALEEGKIDVIMSGMTITPKRAYRVAFSEPYMRSGQILLVRMEQAQLYSGGIYSLMGIKPAIGTIANTTGDFLISKTISRPNITKFKTSKDAVKALVDKKIDVFVHDAPIICHYAAISEGSKITPILQLANEEYLGWAVKKDNSLLLQQLNSFLASKKQDGGLATTIKHWIPLL
jgi:ABC-type amino acid transport substrate-binding protein